MACLSLIEESNLVNSSRKKALSRASEADLSASRYFDGVFLPRRFGLGHRMVLLESGLPRAVAVHLCYRGFADEAFVLDLQPARGALGAGSADATRRSADKGGTLSTRLAARSTRDRGCRAVLFLAFN
jgi:hypothetical protein